MKRVLIADKMSSTIETLFASREIEPIVRPGLNAEELITALKTVDGVVIRSGVTLTADIFKALKNDSNPVDADSRELKVIGRAGIGVDNIDMTAASELGIVVMNTPFGNAVTTAEHTLSMLLAAVRHIPKASEMLHSGKWKKSDFKGREVMGKVLGVVGAGNIGALVIERALGLKMRILVYDPFLTKNQVEQLGGKKVEWEEMLQQADAITFHVPLTDKTQNLINSKTLAQTKPGVVIVNCSRGGVVNEAALKTFLENGHVGAAALDVFETEPLPDNHFLFNVPRLVLTPHLGASTTEAQERVGIQIAEQISDFLLTGEIRNAVNTFSFTAQERSKLAPYTKLCIELASFIATMIETPVQSLKITTIGEMRNLKEEPILSAILYGLFKNTIESINIINVISVIKNRGVQSDFIKSEEHSLYHSLIRIDVKTEKYHYQISGTVLGGNSYIVELQGSTIGAELHEHHLYIINEDKQGLISALSKLLSDEGINIISFHLSSEKQMNLIQNTSQIKNIKTAAAIISLDRPVSVELLKVIKALPLVIKATYVKL